MSQDKKPDAEKTSNQNTSTQEGSPQGEAGLGIGQASEKPAKPVTEEAEQTTFGPEASFLSQDNNDLVVMKERLARALADSENLRKRAERDQKDALRYGASHFARDILNCADNLERALNAISDDIRKEHKEVDTLFSGVEMICRDLGAIFERHHILRLNPKGEPFSYDFHQAVGEQPHDTIEAGNITEVLQVGYKLHDRLLRPAMVMVSKGKEVKSPEVKGDMAQDEKKDKA